MHFAVGMAGAGAIGTVGCLVVRRGWRWLPLAMTAGGFWALVPDLPRLFREDFPGLPLARTLGHHELERWLHAIGDLFFFHRALDQQPRELALHGLIGILLLYNLCLIGFVARDTIRRRRDRYDRAELRALRHLLAERQARQASARPGPSGPDPDTRADPP